MQDEKHHKESTDRESTDRLSDRMAAALAAASAPGSSFADDQNDSGMTPETFLEELAKRLTDKMGNGGAPPATPSRPVSDANRWLKIAAVIVGILLSISGAVWSAAMLTTSKVDEDDFKITIKEARAHHDRYESDTDARLRAIELNDREQTTILKGIEKKLDKALDQ